MKLPLLLVALGLVAAGCVAPAANDLANSALPPAAANLVAHAASGVVPLPAELASLSARVLDVGKSGGEPTLGVDSSGALYVTGGGARVWKSADKGASWSDVSDRSKPRPDLDPYVWLDPTTDRIFSAPLYVVCTNLQWSDNGGKSWEWNPIAGCGVPGHDHQSIVTGPPPKGVTTSGYPNVVYYSYNSFRGDGTHVVTSMDGGKTWLLSDAKVSDGDDCQSALNGAPAVAPDGTAYLPMPRCDGLRIGVSKDAGKTWKTHDVNDVGMLGVRPASMNDDTPFSPNPGIDVDAAGNAVAVFPGKDGRMYFTRSTDGGESWMKPVRASAPQVTTTAYSAIVTGAEGRVAIAYFGTTADTSKWKAPSAQFAPADTKWSLYETFSTDAFADDPTFTTLQVTPDDDPVQVGCIWESGGSNPCRNLGDFFDITQREGRAYVVFADGCQKCATDADSRRSDLRVAVIDVGPSLLDASASLVAYAEEKLEGKVPAKTEPALPALPVLVRT